MTTNGTKEELLALVFQTDMFLVDLPVVVTACLGYQTPAYARFADVVITAVETMIKQFIINKELIMNSAQNFLKFLSTTVLIETSTTDMGNTMAKQDYMVKIANMGFQGLSAVDPFGIAYMMFHFVEPICGPTEFLGEIDDGSLVDALGLTTMDDAFHGSTGTWTKEGDGVVLITFVSTDTKDVTVVVHSGGDKFAKIHVCRGEIVKWKSTVAKLQDKTMYLDRWRPGFLGLPGSGGGSLLLWVPRASHGGHLEMTVKINVS
ncbi:hypothetical protein BBJ29_007732 [Phytophthora kernoviae]|uniref:Jacalin-type lectin domain-containing protein n=1 Tax=Phytophthora kernoviae TaxID=325452 RepID=A0A3F2RLE9_9STRA|nr:hypothetical protein BBJ29_007732 [Phytophthora kernoviae]RLN59751.1 hypothetical protein BBP00_00006336 [Phytophthora kernoviae]